MLLVVDVGNTNIVIGGFSPDGELKFQLRIGTDPKKTTDEYAVLLSSVIAMHNAVPPFEGVILSSVVPAVTAALMGALEDLSSSGFSNRSIHLPEVKSGTATGAPPAAMDCSDKQEMHISVAVS